MSIQPPIKECRTRRATLSKSDLIRKNEMKDRMERICKFIFNRFSRNVHLFN